MAELSLTTVRLYGKTGACMRLCVCVGYVCSVGGEGGDGGCLHLFRKHSSNVT